MSKTVAIAAHTGAVGRIIRQLLEDRDLPIGKVKFLASAHSAGTRLTFRRREVVVEELCAAAFDDVDICLASTPDDVAQGIRTRGGETGHDRCRRERLLANE